MLPLVLELTPADSLTLLLLLLLFTDTFELAREFFLLLAAVRRAEELAAAPGRFRRLLFFTIRALEEWTFRIGETDFMSTRSLSGVRLLTCLSKEAGPPPLHPWGVVGVTEPVEDEVDISLALALGIRRLALKRAFFVLATPPVVPLLWGGGVWPREAKKRSAGLERLSFCGRGRDEGRTAVG